MPIFVAVLECRCGHPNAAEPFEYPDARPPNAWLRGIKRDFIESTAETGFATCSHCGAPMDHGRGVSVGHMKVATLEEAHAELDKLSDPPETVQ